MTHGQEGRMKSEEKGEAVGGQAGSVSATCLCNRLGCLSLREGDPPKKPPTQIKTVCTNSLHKLFCLFSAYFKGKRGDNLYKLSRNCLRKLFVQTVFIWVGDFLGGSSRLPLVLFSENSRRLELLISRNTPHGRWGQGPGNVDPRFPADLPFPLPEILARICRFCDSGEILQLFSQDFPGVSLENPEFSGL